MKSPIFHLSFTGFFLITAVLSADLSKESLGIHPEELKYYKSIKIKCKDGSKSFSKERLNDEFCDCPDGTDEPGTSACPESRFYCQNAGHVPVTLFSSRVNDGICDCCDGSDEYDGKVKCPNTCWEAGKAAREKLMKKIATYQDGVVVRKKDIEQAKLMIAKEEAELLKLRDEEKLLKDLVEKLKERKEQIEKAEEQERIAKEKEEEKLREAQKKANEKASEKGADEKEANEQEKKFEETPPTDFDDFVDGSSGSSDKHVVEEKSDSNNEAEEGGHSAGRNASPDITIEQEKDKTDNTIDKIDHKNEENTENIEGLSREELGRRVASRWTRENVGQQDKEATDNKEEEHEDFANTQDSGDNYEDEYPSDADEDTRKYDEDEIDDRNKYEDEDEEGPYNHDIPYNSDTEDNTDISDFPTLSSSSWLDKIKETFQSVLKAIKLSNDPVDKSEASRVRKEYDDYSKKLSKIQSRISTLSEKLKQDFGPEKEFFSFYNQCFESKQNKYVYKVCPYKQASQVEGHSTTQLGRWDKFEESYKQMHFSNGDHCWNGPDRSLKVKLRCGLKNELADVNEPSRCEYVAVLSTPSVCLEERLQDLRNKLEAMNAARAQSHDEL